MKNMSKVKVTVYLDKETARTLRIIAAERETKISHLIEDLILDLKK